MTITSTPILDLIESDNSTAAQGLIQHCRSYVHYRLNLMNQMRLEADRLLLRVKDLEVSAPFQWSMDEANKIRKFSEEMEAHAEAISSWCLTLDNPEVNANLLIHELDKMAAQ